jgi:hypothetical protein
MSEVEIVAMEEGDSCVGCGHSREDHREGLLNCGVSTLENGEYVDCACEGFEVAASKLTTAPLPEEAPSLIPPGPSAPPTKFSCCGASFGAWGGVWHGQHKPECPKSSAPPQAAPVGEREGESRPWLTQGADLGFEKFYEDEIRPGIAKDLPPLTKAGFFQMCEAGWKGHAYYAALASKSSPAPEEIPERPRTGYIDSMGIWRYAPNQFKYLSKDADSVFDALEALLSAKDVEIENHKSYGEMMKNSGNGLYAAIWPIVDEYHPLKNHRDSEWDVLPSGIRFVIEHYKQRAEAAEAELTSLRASRARIEEETLRKAIELLSLKNLNMASEVFTRLLQEVKLDHPRTYGTALYFLAQTCEAEHFANWNARRKEFLALLSTSPEKEQTGEEG